jgi:hypothetical protein
VNYSFLLARGLRLQHALPFLLCLSLVSANAQVNERNSFQFLNRPHAARLAALGGVNVSLTDIDLNFFASNPSLAGDTLAGIASASYQFYVADIGQAYFSYAHDFKTLGPVLFGLQHIGYGNIQGYDANGVETGEFNAGETAVMIGKNHQVKNFRFGATLKGVFSNIAGYRAGAVVLDLGGVFMHPSKRFTAGMTIKNFGLVLKDYTSGTRLPFDVQVGVTLKPEHMPLRFSFTAFNLTQTDIPYNDLASESEKPGVMKRVLSHVNLGTEILVHKSVTVMAGYNYLVHQELKLNGGGGGAGLSFGFSAAIRSFEFVFSRSGYVAGNAGYSFTLSTDINKIFKRRLHV